MVAVDGDLVTLHYDCTDMEGEVLVPSPDHPQCYTSILMFMPFLLPYRLQPEHSSVPSLVDILCCTELYKSTPLAYDKVVTASESAKCICASDSAVAEALAECRWWIHRGQGMSQ